MAEHLSTSIEEIRDRVRAPMPAGPEAMVALVAARDDIRHLLDVAEAAQAIVTACDEGIAPESVVGGGRFSRLRESLRKLEGPT
jgi:hypothetical protein